MNQKLQVVVEELADEVTQLVVNRAREKLLSNFADGIVVATPTKRKPGRPKGSKNKPKDEVKTATNTAGTKKKRKLSEAQLKALRANMAKAREARAKQIADKKKAEAKAERAAKAKAKAKPAAKKTSAKRTPATKKTTSKKRTPAKKTA